MRVVTLILLYFVIDLLIAQPNPRIVGNKSYELSNHLGNVLEVTTDRKVVQQNEAEIVTFNDYYPYGMLMQGRNGQKDTSNYRYAFQGQEKDDGIKGAGNSYNYTYRMHDSRLGRFFAVDPLSKEYPYNSTYAFSENRVIDGIELEGLEVFFVNGYLGYGPRIPSLKYMKDYWNKKNNFSVRVSYYLNEYDSRYINGHRARLNDGLPFSDPISRYMDGFQNAINMIKNGELVLDNDRPVTFVGHSQGNAHALGMISAIRMYEKKINEKSESKENTLHVDINFIMLAVFQGENKVFQGIHGLDVNAIQFTYENDYLGVNDVIGVTDANSEERYNTVDGEPTSQGEAHSDVIDRREAWNEIKKEDEENQILKKKKKQ